MKMNCQSLINVLLLQKDMQSDITYSFQAKITMLPTAKGGRKKSIFSGYRPSFVFNTQKHYCGEIELIDREELQPGESTLVEIHLFPAHTIRKNLDIDTAFTLVEGNKTVGQGVVEKIIKKETAH
jgi:translation elongation factor EF-Tu-like GTPase